MPGESAATIAGIPVSLDGNGGLVIGSTTVSVVGESKSTNGDLGGSPHESLGLRRVIHIFWFGNRFFGCDWVKQDSGQYFKRDICYARELCDTKWSNGNFRFEYKPRTKLNDYERI